MEIVLVALGLIGIVGMLSVDGESAPASEVGKNSPPDEDGAVLPVSHLVVETEFSDNIERSVSMENSQLSVNGIRSIEWDEPGSVERVVGSDRADLITLESNSTMVLDSLGGDTIDAGSAHSSLVFASNGDLVFTSDIQTNSVVDNVVVLENGGSVEPGAGGNSLFVLGSNDMPLDLGAGDDLLVSDKGASHLLGGEGNDTLIGQGELHLTGSSASSLIQVTDSEIDILDGGAGNDRIVLSGYDTAIGGTGNDTIVSLGQSNRVLDFDVQDDRLIVALEDVAFSSDIQIESDLKLISSSDGVDLQLYGESLVFLENVEGVGVTIFDANSNETKVISTPGWSGDSEVQVFSISTL